MTMFASPALPESRFGRDVLKVADPASYQTFKLDENTYYSKEGATAGVACTVYKGKQYYYVEVGVLNKTAVDIALAPDFVTFDKSNYTAVRRSASQAALLLTQA